MWVLANFHYLFNVEGIRVQRELCLVFIFTALEIIQMPRSQAVQEGKKFVLSCRARGLPDIRYRWVKDDAELPGANRSDLVLEPVQMQDFGRYVCRVWDKSGSATSDTAEIDVFPASEMSTLTVLK